MFSVREAAAILKVSGGTLYKLVEKKRIRHVRPSGLGRGRIRFRQSDLDEWIESCVVCPKVAETKALTDYEQMIAMRPDLRHLPPPEVRA